MKYVIMCGGKYDNFKEPKQFTIVNGERIVDRTCRLLREHNIEDVIIVSNDMRFDSCSFPRVENKQNNFSQTKSWTNIKGWWLDAFYHTNEPTCYLFGDVFYSDAAMKKIIEAETDDCLLFGSDPSSSEGYLIKSWYEPLAVKVVNYKRFYKGIEEVKKLYTQGKVKRHPIAWELYRHLFNLDINGRQLEEHFICINDCSTDIDNVNDNENDAKRIEYFLNKEKGICNQLSKVFGIISWLPNKEPARGLRIERLDRAFKQIYDLFGDVNFLVIAQNWKDYQVPSYLSNVQIVKCEPLGILGARKKLREEFLKTNYDYLIMCDDDVIIEQTGPLCAELYMDELNMNPHGFMFLQYDAAQLNLCAISRYIYEKERMVNIDPQKGEGYEDVVFAWLLHYKYPKNEFYAHGLKCIQFLNRNEKAPSTWASTNAFDHNKMAKLSWYHIRKFEKGDFTIDKKQAEIYVAKQKFYERALEMGWINKEDIGKTC